MGIIVEDGTGLADANSYASEDDLDTYTDDRGLTLASGDAEAALIRATTFIDATYRGRFPGYKTKLREQALEWPRTIAYDNAWNLIPGDEVPTEIINATLEAAIRELATPGSLMPDLKRGGAIKRVKAGSVEVEYAGNASSMTTFNIIDGILSGLLSGGSGGGLFGIAVRG